MSKYICDKCCGDGLHHNDPDVFESFVDDVCPQCQGVGVTEDAGNPVDYKIVSKNTNEDFDLDFYMGEGVDDYEELPVEFHSVYYAAEYGSREGGLQMEPDYPASFELDSFYFKLNNEWYEFEPTESQYDECLKSISDDGY